MKPQDKYIAKEAFTFPLFSLVCLAFNTYWGCTDGWPVGAIIGTSFFGIITLVYIFKYLCCGRNYLKINADGITYKEWRKTNSLKWFEIAKCSVCYRPSYGGVLFYRELDMALLSETKHQKSISVRLSGKYCRNKSVINAIEQFGGIDIFDEQSSQSQNKYLIGILLLAVATILFIALISCNNRHDITDNYAVFTYGEGLYGESEKDYPIFVSKLGYKDEPSFIANVRHLWWNDSTVVIEQNNDSWWIITAADSRLSYGDQYVGPLSVQRKDSIIYAEKISIEQMKHRNYE